MKQQELFQLIVRVLGLYLVLLATRQIYTAALNLILPGSSNLSLLLAGGIPALAIGLWFLKGAKSLVTWAFREKSAAPK